MNGIINNGFLCGFKNVSDDETPECALIDYNVRSVMINPRYDENYIKIAKFKLAPTKINNKILTNPTYRVIDDVLFVQVWNSERSPLSLVLYPPQKNDKEYVLPDNVIKVSPGALRYCSFLEVFNCQFGLERIEFGAFKDCKSLKKIILSDSLKLIDEYAFMDCNSLEEIKVPDQVVSIAPSAFIGCTSLKTLYLGAAAEEYPANTFINCKNLTTVNFTSNIPSVKSGLFLFNYNLDRVNVIEDSYTYSFFGKNIIKKYLNAFLDFTSKNSEYEQGKVFHQSKGFLRAYFALLLFDRYKTKEAALYLKEHFSDLIYLVKNYSNCSYGEIVSDFSEGKIYNAK